jgi:hypothetical protein
MMLLPLVMLAAQATDYNKMEEPDLIPSALRGAWDMTVEACKDPNSTTRMQIGANWITFYEAHGLLQISTPAGLPDTDESLAARFVMSGEGATWDNELVFGWDKAQANRLIAVEAKTAENMMSQRKRERWVKCS